MPCGKNPPKKRERREPVPRSALPPDVWKVDHVAAFLGCGRDYVYDQVAAGQLPHVKRGGLLIFTPEKVASWAKGEG